MFVVKVLKYTYVNLLFLTKIKKGVITYFGAPLTTKNLNDSLERLAYLLQITFQYTSLGD